MSLSQLIKCAPVSQNYSLQSRVGEIRFSFSSADQPHSEVRIFSGNRGDQERLSDAGVATQDTRFSPPCLR
nr:hypothetical protein [Arthrobacter gallicola]